MFYCGADRRALPAVLFAYEFEVKVRHLLAKLPNSLGRTVGRTVVHYDDLFYGIVRGEVNLVDLPQDLLDSRFFVVCGDNDR